MEKYNLVIDIGNTNIVFGIYHDNQLNHSWRCITDKNSDYKCYFEKINSSLQSFDVPLNNISAIAVSNVVPSLLDTFQGLFVEKFNCPHVFVNAYTALGLSFPMLDPGFVGADLVASSFAAWQKHKTNCLICDFGTATTFHLVSSDGFFFGSAIAPGVNTAANGLFQKASQLFDINLEKPEKLLGTNTKASMLSGIINGNLFMMDGFIQAIKKEYQHLGKILTIATGGIAELICHKTQEVDLIDPNLVLDGLNMICQKNINYA